MARREALQKKEDEEFTDEEWTSFLGRSQTRTEKEGEEANRKKLLAEVVLLLEVGKSWRALEK